MVGSSGRCAKTFPANQEAGGNLLDSSPAWGAVMKKVASLQGRRTYSGLEDGQTSCSSKAEPRFTIHTLVQTVPPVPSAGHSCAGLVKLCRGSQMDHV